MKGRCNNCHNVHKDTMSLIPVGASFCSYPCLATWAGRQAGSMFRNEDTVRRLEARIASATPFVRIVAKRGNLASIPQFANSDHAAQEAMQWLVSVGNLKPVELVVPEYCQQPPGLCSGKIAGRAEGKWMCEKHLNEAGYAVVTIG